MVCDNCGSTEAVVHLTQIVNNQMSTHRLCEKCAAEKGLESAPEPANVPLTDFLAQMGKDPVVESDPAGTKCSSVA
jgi:protein arginine kinase activator